MNLPASIAILSRNSKENIVKTGAESRVNLLKGNTHEKLSNLSLQSFDLINLQDRCKLSQHTEKNAQLAWQLAKSGAYIVFSYYGWQNPQNPQQNPRVGIDRFLSSIQHQWQPVNFSPQIFQLIIQKL